MDMLAGCNKSEQRDIQWDVQNISVFFYTENYKLNESQARKCSLTKCDMKVMLEGGELFVIFIYTVKAEGDLRAYEGGCHPPFKQTDQNASALLTHGPLVAQRVKRHRGC